ncbi:histone H1-like [Pristis pectinata]|uniref:histone H1-like n=1 Tax=Pristis pectinata TaxID=685728 RepID=UPI00223DA7E0|nr:histone H1-like [Pristis pectinata]
MSEGLDAAKVDWPPAAVVDSATVFGPPLPSATCMTLPPVTKKKSSYRPAQTGSVVAEQILEAVAATKERQAPKLGAIKKVISAAGYDAEETVARPGQSVKSFTNKGSLAQGGADGSLATPPQQEVEGAASEKPRVRKTAAGKTHRKVKGRKIAKKSALKLKKARKLPTTSRTVKVGARRRR